MIYVTSTNISLLIYHIKQVYKQNPTIKKPVSAIELQEYLYQGGQLNETLTEIIPSIYIVEYEGTVKEFKQAEYNITYILVPDLSEWKKVETDNIKLININPSLYKGIVEPFRALFEQEAFDYFWEVLCLNKFRCNPNKWNAEITSLLIRRRSKEHRFSSEELENLYNSISPDLFSQYLLYFTKEESRKILYKMSDTHLWSIFIGTNNKPPALYKYLVEKKRGENIYILISQLQLAIEYNKCDLRLGCYIVNEFICNLGINRSNMEVNITPEQVMYLNSLLGCS